MLAWKIEYLPLVVNIGCLGYYCYHRPFEIGKFFYWLGAILLTVGLIKMKG